MDFDEYCKTLYLEDFLDILSFEGKIYGEARYNLTDHELLESLFTHIEKFKVAKGVCLCFSKELFCFENWKAIYELLQYGNIETYFIKINPKLKAEEQLSSYQLLLSGIEN